MTISHQQEQAIILVEKMATTKRRSLPTMLKGLGGLNPSSQDLDDSGRTLPWKSESFATSDLKSCMKNKSSSNKKKTVSFDTIQVHEHHVVLGDNPAVTSGPPLAIAWEPQESFSVSVDAYEEDRPTRRSKEAMLVPPAVREDWLRTAGYARSHFAEATRSIQKVKRQRAASAQVPFLKRVFERKAIAVRV